MCVTALDKHSRTYSLFQPTPL